MPRFSISGRTTNAPTAALPGSSLYAPAAQRLKVVTVEIYNTTDTSIVILLRRLTTAGTPGSAVTAAKITDPEGPAAGGTGKDSHTGTGPTLGDEIRRATLGAAKGSGAVWTFDGGKLNIEKGVANGIGFLSLGTAQPIDYVIEWDE